MDKKASETFLTGFVIFIVLNVLFIGGMILFIGTRTNNVGIYEQGYAKQIALLIDNAKPGTTIVFDMAKMYETARKNKRLMNIVELNDENKIVKVRLTNSGEGYAFRYFNGGNVKILENRYLEKLTVEIK